MKLVAACRFVSEYHQGFLRKLRLLILHSALQWELEGGVLEGGRRTIATTAVKLLVLLFWMPIVIYESRPMAEGHGRWGGLVHAITISQ